MNEVARQLGLPFITSMKARDAVMKLPAAASLRRLRDDHTNIAISSLRWEKASCHHHNSNKQYYECCDPEDDDTASTVSSVDDTSFSTCSASVSFATPLVTAVHVRPITSAKEKQDLYYTDFEYREFRRDYHYSRRESKVKIHDDVVTAVYHIPVCREPQTLYYSETDLQGFLDEFVASLNQPWP